MTCCWERNDNLRPFLAPRWLGTLSMLCPALICAAWEASEVVPLLAVSGIMLVAEDERREDAVDIQSAACRKLPGVKETHQKPALGGVDDWQAKS